MAAADTPLTAETQTYPAGWLPGTPEREQRRSIPALPCLAPGRYLAVSDDADAVLQPRAAGRYLASEDGAGVVVLPLTAEVTYIGRSPAADIVIDDTSVSRRHALLARRGERTLILDNRSLNGVLVNGERVSEAGLNDGDTITVGHVVLHFVERG